MNVGDLVKFRHVYNGFHLNNKSAIYLGESRIHRSDGVTIVNHVVLPTGASNPCTIDKRLLGYISTVNQDTEVVSDT